MEVRTCKNCKKMFNYISGQPLCPVCRDLFEKKFQEVKAYIRETPGCSVAAVADAMDVSPNQIKQWIREERLQFSDAASSGIFCEQCNAPITGGRFCEACKKKMAATFSSVLDKPKEAERHKAAGTDSSMRFRHN